MKQVIFKGPRPTRRYSIVSSSFCQNPRLGCFGDHRSRMNSCSMLTAERTGE
ncbi:hypothetical protein BJX63DRAFT_377766 [Aspergillus granulosus]|uniref:Uncharacterized protein n=1 Tax=Aspergillus granulosus TaxID=176169 RepID=A0ABR4I3Z3_9EURO